MQGDPIKICLIIHSLGIGGMERVMAELVSHFAKKKGVVVHLVLVGIRRNIEYPIPETIFIHRPGFQFNNSRRTIDTVRTMRFIRSRVRQIAPDTVLSFGELWNNLVLLSLWRTEIPVYISDRSEPDKDLGRLHNYLRDKLYPLAAGYIAQTGKAKEVCLKKGWNENVKVIGNPIRKIERTNSVKKENIVLTVGRLIKTKHVDHMIRMFHEIGKPGWKLLVVGGDAGKMSLSEELQDLIDELDAGDTISLEGRQKDVERYYNRSKLFAFTSSSEGFPNVIGEALSAGLPVVAYDCKAGPADMIEDGENGFLIPLFDQQKFKERLNQLMTDKPLRESLGDNARRVISKFESGALSNEFYKFITTEYEDRN